MKNHISLLFICFVSTGVFAQLFETEEPLCITLDFDYTYVVKDRGERPTPYPAVMTYQTASGEEEQIKLKIRTRGHSRKLSNVCDFPPLMFHFDDDAVENTVFHEQRKLKLVTHCRNGRRFQEMNYKEYLAYRMYNELTDRSFRVRRVEITYRDFRGKDKITRDGFLIEEDKQLRKRLDLKKVDADERDEYSSEEVHLAKIALFNYMIGNTDWSAREVHNLELFREKGNEKTLVYVPYDFDWSGLVNAPYATPQTVFGIRSVTERAYPLECFSEASLETALQEMRSQKAAIDRMVNRTHPVKNKESNRMKQFYQTFWQEADRADFISNFRRSCD